MRKELGLVLSIDSLSFLYILLEAAVILLTLRPNIGYFCIKYYICFSIDKNEQTMNKMCPNFKQYKMGLRVVQEE